MAPTSTVAVNAVDIGRGGRDRRRGDLVAGITVAAYLVPQVMSYAQLAGLPAVVGLWAITASLLVYAFVGTSRQLSVGPESTTALMTASILGSIAAGDPARYVELAATLALLVGVVAAIAWLLRLGFLADLLSKPVLAGYMAGVAVVMIIGQLGTVTGVEVDGDSSLGELRSFVDAIGDVHGPTLALAATTLVVMLVLHRLVPTAPVPLVAVLLGALAVVAFGLDDRGVAVVGSIPAGLPPLSLPSLAMADVAVLIGPAIGIAVVGYSDNVLVGRSFAARRRTRIDANQEWLAMGATNAAASLVGGMPVSSSGSRTVIGDAVGSRSQVHSLVAVVVVAVVLLVGGSVLERFPVAALGAIVVWAAIRLVDRSAFAALARFRRSEVVIALLAAVGVVVVGALYGVLVAVGMSVLDLVRRVARPHDGILGYVPGLAGMHDVDDYPTARLVPGLVVYRYDAPLCFANAEDFARRALDAVDQVDAPDAPVEWFLLNAEAIVDLDLTALEALESLCDSLAARDVEFAMARVKTDLRTLLPDRFVDRVGADRVFPTLPTAVAAYVRWYTERHGAPPAGVTAVEPPPSPLG